MEHIQHIATGDIQFTMKKFICALEACTFSGLGTCFPKKFELRTLVFDQNPTEVSSYKVGLSLLGLACYLM